MGTDCSGGKCHNIPPLDYPQILSGMSQVKQILKDSESVHK